MKRFSLFFTGLVLSLFRHIGSLALSAVLVIVGAIWTPVCLYIGLALLLVNLLVAIASAARMQKMASVLCEDNSTFAEMMEKLTSGSDDLLGMDMEEQEKVKSLHGEDLLTLSDDKLSMTVFFQNLEIGHGAEDGAEELARFEGARRTVYILATFDAEVQNGGLCQFFVNSSRAVAPYVLEALAAVGAEEHHTLLQQFVSSNGIDLCDLDSFSCRSIKAYTKQTKRFDFDSFDDAYYELPPLEEKTVAYIKANIQEF